MRDNTHVTAPGDHSTGYHLTADLIDEAIGFLAGHVGAIPDDPWFLMVAPGACHAPHQAPRDLIDKYTERFEKGWDRTRDDRLARQIESGIVPAGTTLPPRNLGVRGWDEHDADEQRLFARLAGAYGAMLEHFDQHLGRLIDFVETSGMLDDTIVLVLSDNGASQEGGPLGFVNAMGPFNMIAEPMADKLARIDDIGGPDTHSNFPHGWAMAANTPLKRYKQNTHGGGIRDPLVVRLPDRLAPDAVGGLRHQFCHASDLAPTLLELLGIDHVPAMRASASLRRSPTPMRSPARPRSTSRCSAIGGSGTTGSRRWPTTRRPRRSTTTSGSSTTSPRLQREPRPRGRAARPAGRTAAAVVGRGRGQPGAPPRRPVR